MELEVKIFEEMDSLLRKNDMVRYSTRFYASLLLILPILLAEYKPMLEEVERILQEAGLEEGDMRAAAAAGGRDGGLGVQGSRNRR